MKDDNSLRSLVTAESPLAPISLRRLIRNYRVLGGSESELLEFKATFQGGTRQWVSVLREMVGFSNTRGGIIIFGVAADGELVGCPPRALQRLDPAVVQDKLRKYSPGSKLDVNTTSIHYYGKTYVGVKVHQGRRPIIFDHDGNYPDERGETRQAFSAGILYMRSPGKTHPATQADLDTLLLRVIESRISRLLAKTEQVAKLPEGSSLVALSSSKSSRGALLVGDEQAIPVRIEPEDPDAVPIAEILADGPFASEQSEVLSQVKIWRGNPEYRVDVAALNKWLLSRNSLEWDSFSAEVCLRSALANYGFPLFWASALPKEELRTICEDEIQRDAHPAIASLPYAIRAFLWDDSRDLLNEIIAKSSKVSARWTARKLLSNKDPTWLTTRSRYSGRTVRFQTLEGEHVVTRSVLFSDREIATGVFNQLVQSESEGVLAQGLRMVIHQLDLFLHSPLGERV